MANLSRESCRKQIKIWSIVTITVLLCVLVRIILKNNITSVAEFQKFIQRFGAAGPLFLTLFQAFQVIVPVVPGYLGCAAGALAFGSSIGFLCNYIGISAGSIGAYFIARTFGLDVILTLFSEKQFIKWSDSIKRHRSFGFFLFIATLLPLFPDDFLCYFSGLIKMDPRKFIFIIILGKPWCILAYSIAFGLIK